MSSNLRIIRLAFVAFIVFQSILWSHSRYASSASISDSIISGILRRSVGGEVCAPLSVPLVDQCAYVKEHCGVENTFLSIPYLHSYFCSAPAARPFIFGALLVWLFFLFSTLGISASDFFCPNLATLAARLGLDENVAGVTFLALGNGSPDVFSTFSAMRAGAGALAIGELLGAASFIVSVVAGTMCIIRPFSVDARPFLRDVGFFTVAVALLLGILWDEHIRAWEAATLIGLYVVYVIVVVVGTWWDKRQFRKKQLEAIVRGEYADEELPEPYRDEPSDYLSIPAPRPHRQRAHSSPAVPSALGLETDALRPRHHSRSPSPALSPQISQMPSFSLVGALEFRQVIASLQNQSAGASLHMFESPVSPYAGGHYHHHAHSLSRRTSSRSSHSVASQDTGRWDGPALPLHPRSPHSQNTVLQGSSDRESTASPPPALTVPGGRGRGREPSEIPLISTIPASPTGTSETSFDAGNLGLLSSPGGAQGHCHHRTCRQRIVRAFRHTLHVLFPTLHNMREKSVLGMIASVFAVPAVLFLTVTLPVQVTPRNASEHEEKIGSERAAIVLNGNGVVPEGRLVDFEEEGIERVLTAEDDVQEEMHELKFNKWLMAVQMVLGPLFCVAVLFSGMDWKREVWVLLATFIAGVAGAILVLAFAKKGNDPLAQMARCFMGFFVAVVWIMAIADEVVNVLKTFGFIFGLSDAIIGLTIFAVGNSLADFVANVSVAAFAPVMGFSACFGGPMLNMLLGVGISGSVVVRSQHKPYALDFSETLVVSALGLLVLLVATMVCVPLNGYHLTRSWGIFLVLSYLVIMAVNITVEVRMGRGS